MRDVKNLLKRGTNLLFEALFEGKDMKLKENVNERHHGGTSDDKSDKK